MKLDLKKIERHCKSGEMWKVDFMPQTGELVLSFNDINGVVCSPPIDIFLLQEAPEPTPLQSENEIRGNAIKALFNLLMKNTSMSTSVALDVAIKSSDLFMELRNEH